MAINDHTALAIAELVFYIPALNIAVFVCFRHGRGRFGPWFFIGNLALIRIVGGILSIVANNNHDLSLIITAAVLNGVGLSLLLLSMLSMLKRVNEGIASGGIPALIFNLLHIPIIVATALAAYGSIKLYGEDVSKHETGRNISRVGIVIFVLVFVFFVVLNAYTFLRSSSVRPGEKRILLATGASLPFIAVRIVYTLLAYFVTGSNTFSLRNGSIAVQAAMGVAEEWVTVILYLAAGILAPKIAREEVRVEQFAWGTQGRGKGDEQEYPLNQYRNS
ncbi:MAG: hypothetical protein Q9214_001422 [Letrouitia sp. 1 TL-2023]